MKRVFLTIVFLFFIKIIVFSQNSNEFTLTKVTFNISNVNENNKTQLDNQLKEIKGIYKYEFDNAENKVISYLNDNFSKEQLQTLLTQKGFEISNINLEGQSVHKINKKSNTTVPIESITKSYEKKELTTLERINRLKKLVEKRKDEGREYHKYELEIERLEKEISK